MSSLLDVAKAMNAETVSHSATLSLVDIACEKTEHGLVKPLTLTEMATLEMQPNQTPKQTLHPLTQEEDRSRIQVALESAANDVKVERQELRSQTLKQTSCTIHQEMEQAAQVLHEKVASAVNAKHNVVDPDSNKENDDDDGYSSFEDDDDTLKKDTKQKSAEVAEEDDPAEVEATNDPPPRTTPCESEESKEFLRAVYRADKYQIRDMLDNEVVDANIADQHGWSGLHWAASQHHSDVLKLLVQKGCEVNAIDQINGWTALHVAVVRASVACILVLLSSGADPRIRDNYGDTAVECLQAASGKEKVKMLQLLQEARRNT